MTSGADVFYTDKVPNEINIHRLEPLGTKLIIKRGQVETNFAGALAHLVIPESHRDRNDLNGQLYTGIVIAVGPKTKAARFGRKMGWYEPGDKIWMWDKYDWDDHKIVITDEDSKDSYLVIDESCVKAFEVAEMA